MQFVADLAAQRRRRRCRSCTGSAASATWPSQTLDHLGGYEGARPVRIGNGAYNQRQNDVFGAVLDSIYLHTKTGGHIPQRLWGVIEDQVKCAIDCWDKPDQGIWEARGEPKHYVSSKLMCWVAARPRRPPRRARGEMELARAVAGVADEIRADILDQGRLRARRLPPALRHRCARRLDAADSAGPLPAPRRRARARDRARDRRRAHRAGPGASLPHRGDRRRPPRRGGHVPDLLLLAGLGAVGDRRARARDHALERLLSHASPLGLFAEELDAAQRPPPRQLPAGVHAPGADQRRAPRDRDEESD